MSGLKERIIRLESRLPVGLEAELRAFTDEELDARIAKLEGVTVEEVRAWSAEE
jgi:hypothetical protein